jgi:UTP--glucose-1-phosphate uridylyltransferase
LIEKPKPEETTSNLAAFGRYFVTKELAHLSRTTTPGKDGELWFVDSVIRYMNEAKRVAVCPLRTGNWYTVGDPAGYLQAVQASMTAC